MARDFAEDGAWGATSDSNGAADGGFGSGASSANTSPYYGTWGADTGAAMQDGSSNTTGVNGNTQRGQKNSFGKEIGSDMSYDDWMKYGGGNFGAAPPTRPSTPRSDAELAGDPNLGATAYHGVRGTSNNPWGSQTQSWPSPPIGGAQDTSGQTPWGSQFRQNTGFIGFAEGGAIDEDPNGTDQMNSGMGNQLQQQINAALGVVDNVLSYGRKLHGLGGGDDGAISEKPQQMAGRTDMPVRPGGQSETGIPPERPAPGRLPPTSNPFGKRADASTEQSEGDDQSTGAIDTEEQETA